MATVGHTLVGLSLGGLSRAESRGGAFRSAWPGLMVLMAHLVDIAEWVLILVAPKYFDQHFVTNTPLVTTGLVLASWALLALLFRVRKLWPYILVALAVFSHLLLDYGLARAVLSDIYGQAPTDELPGLLDAVAAEVWLYGLLLVCVGLMQAARQRDCPLRGRAVAGVLAALAIFAAIMRTPALWVPAYLLAMLHTLLLLRRALRPRLLWSLVPAAPLIALLSVELWAGHQHDRARALEKDKHYAAAARVYRRALAVRTRSRQSATYAFLSRCQRHLGELAAAEATILEGIRRSDEPELLRFALASLYSDRRARGSLLFRPAEAAGILREVLDSRASMTLKGYAQRRLDRMRRQGMIE